MGSMPIASDAVLTHPSLGQDVQLGMLYDVRTSQFFGGLSLWKNADVNAKQELDDEKIQNAEYSFSYSLEEARNNSNLDIEGSLTLDLKMFSATGSAKYLNDKKSSTHEARIDATCTIVRRTRRIPQETLASMNYEKYLDDPRFTHFVAEVVEGGSATLSFVRSCSSAEEAKKITGELKVSIVKIPVSGSAKVEFSEGSESLFENVKISYSGALAENVANLDDAQRVAKEMPTKLAKQLNTLQYKLLPLSLLDTRGNRLIRSLDAGLVKKTAVVLNAGVTAGLKLKDLLEDDIFKKQFPAIRKQISYFQAAFATVETEFTKDARRLLPELRDGNTDENAKITELQSSVALFERRTEIAEGFISMKQDEANVLRSTVATLLADNFENYLGGLKPGSLIDAGAPRLLLSLGGSTMAVAKHPLQAQLEAKSASSGEENAEAEDEVEEEWFENQQTVSNLRNSCVDLRQQRLLATPDSTVTFGVASVDKAWRVGGKKQTKTSVGDILLDHGGKITIVTGMLPTAPTAPQLKVDGQTIAVSWSHEREESLQLVIPTKGFAVKYRRRLNPLKDGAFPRASENEAFIEIRSPPSETNVTLRSLSDDCDYEVAISVQTTVGASPWSSYAVERTGKSESVARDMINFFHDNQGRLTKKLLGEENLKPEDNPKRKPWDLHSPKGNKRTLYLGLNEIARRYSMDDRFQNEVAVRIVDVAPEFKPEVRGADIGDQANTLVVVFAGTSGHGKSTQINAFISYLLGGEIDDEARTLVIDDRGAKQSGSVTQIVTCFRIRPLSPLFGGKTMLIVDTPGYGDSRGPERDAFVTAAMSEFFKTVDHVNSIVFTCRANEVRTTLLSPVSTYIFSLFAKDVQRCLRTLYTFSDAGDPLARGALQQLGWPVENGEIRVNNSAFTVELTGSEQDIAVREGWLQSVRGQFQLMQMLLMMAAVPTKASSEVTQKRMHLEQKCVLAEKNILKTANDAQNIITLLDSLASAIGRSPGDKVKVYVTDVRSKNIPQGKFTTLCRKCNYSCHEICGIPDDGNKVNCDAMENGKCTVCPGKCGWAEHHNSTFILERVQRVEEMVPHELIKKWNEGNNLAEGALINVMDEYLRLQESLRNDMLKLTELSDELTDKALRHDPNGLINYIDTLIQTARARGAPPAQLIQLTTAKNTLLILKVLTGTEKKATRDSVVLIDVITAVRAEMDRRKNLSANERAIEEEKPCNVYNNLRAKLPVELQKKAPPELKMQSTLSRGALYPENLKAVVRLVQLVLKDGGVVAALAEQGA